MWRGGVLPGVGWRRWWWHERGHHRQLGGLARGDMAKGERQGTACSRLQLRRRYEISIVSWAPPAAMHALAGMATGVSWVPLKADRMFLQASTALNGRLIDGSSGSSGKLEIIEGLLLHCLRNCFTWRRWSTAARARPAFSAANAVRTSSACPNSLLLGLDAAAASPAAELPVAPAAGGTR
jgi:hypothetical protein